MKAARHHRCFTTRPGKWTQTLTQLGFMLTVHHWTLRFQSCVWGTLFHLRTGRWVCMPSFPSHINPLRLSHMLARVRLPAQQYGSSLSFKALFASSMKSKTPHTPGRWADIILSTRKRHKWMSCKAHKLSDLSKVLLTEASIEGKFRFLG